MENIHVGYKMFKYNGFGWRHIGDTVERDYATARNKAGPASDKIKMRPIFDRSK